MRHEIERKSISPWGINIVRFDILRPRCVNGVNYILHLFELHRSRFQKGNTRKRFQRIYKLKIITIISVCKIVCKFSSMTQVSFFNLRYSRPRSTQCETSCGSISVFSSRALLNLLRIPLYNNHLHIKQPSKALLSLAATTVAFIQCVQEGESPPIINKIVLPCFSII